MATMIPSKGKIYRGIYGSQNCAIGVGPFVVFPLLIENLPAEYDRKFRCRATISEISSGERREFEALPVKKKGPIGFLRERKPDYFWIYLENSGLTDRKFDLFGEVDCEFSITFVEWTDVGHPLDYLQVLG